MCTISLDFFLFCQSYIYVLFHGLFFFYTNKQQNTQTHKTQNKIATFICGYEIRQLSVSSRYGVEDFKEELRQMYIAAGSKGIGLVFLLTDSHIVDEKFLIYVNDLLSNGYIPDLFPQDELGM